MRRTLVLVLSLAFTLIFALQAQLPANLDGKCTATGGGEYLMQVSRTASVEPSQASAKAVSSAKSES